MSVHPLRIALQLDSLTRSLYNEKRGQYEESLFNNKIIELLEINDEDRPNLPLFLLGEWYALHLVYINDPHFHSENIKKASAIEEHLRIRSRMVGGSPSNTGNIDKDGELDEDDAGDDFKHTTKDDDGEVDDDNAASDSIEHNIADLKDDDEVDDINHAIINNEKNDCVDELPNYVPCDWEESGLCILIRQQPTKKCQHPGGGCANYVHHLCMIQWAFANNMPADESIGAV